MSRKAKILAISVALASLAAFSRCGGDGKSDTLSQISEVAEDCNIGLPPSPPNEMFGVQGACFGEVECSQELKLEIARWVFDLSAWTQKATVCSAEVRSLVKE